MSLNKVWNKYDTEKDAIQNHERYCITLGILSAVIFGAITVFKSADDNIWMSILSILSLVISIYQLLRYLICQKKEKQLKAWLTENYRCPSCGMYLGNSSPSSLGDMCKKCRSSINYYKLISVEDLNLNLKGWAFASAFFCLIIASALFCIGYLYPYSILHLDLNPNSVYRKLANDMVFVHGGPSRIGATKDQTPETNEFPDEHPDIPIEVSDFYICKHEVTQDLWKEVMGDNPSHHQGDKLPMESVSYIDCLTFIKKLNKKSGNNYRLPTEIEWEYAARGGRHPNHTKYAGSQNIEDVAWYDQNSGKTTHEVCLLGPNELGLYDMNGNVLEWCMSFYTKKGYTEKNTEDTLYVLRGGSFSSEAARSRVAYRLRAEKGLKKNGMGLRLVRK